MTSESEFTSSPDITLYDSFDNMGLPDTLLRGIYSYGYENPSQIQRVAIKVLLISDLLFLLHFFHIN